MFSVQIDDEAVKQLIRERVSRLVREVDAEMVFWDSKELVRRTCMSFDTIQNTFFFAPGFPKVKIGGKWYFPTRKTREFLEQWIDEQQRK